MQVMPQLMQLCTETAFMKHKVTYCSSLYCTVIACVLYCSLYLSVLL
jgi:hypothetical protein